jgi:biotin-[acetyl-CoA-carboxylase] ligase BirA-like protein
MKEEFLPSNRFEKIYRFKEVTSTMDVCEDLIKSGVCKGIVVADSQTSGRGRNSKKWVSEANGNIYLSFFDELNVGLIPQRCAVASFLAAGFFVKERAEVRIKWANDILIDLGKVSGVIAKSVISDNKRFYVCGIGVNVFPPDESTVKFVWRPASLSGFAEVTTEKVLDKLVESISCAFSASSEEILLLYAEKTGWMIGKEIVFSQDLINNEKGRIVGFSDDFSVVKIDTGSGMKELSALSILSII